MKPKHILAGSLVLAFLIIAGLAATGLFSRPPQAPTGTPGDSSNNQGTPREMAQRQYVLELSRPLTAAEKEQLQNHAECGDSLGGSSVLVRSGEKELQKLNSLPFVKRAEEYKPEQKLSQDLGGGDNTRHLQVMVTLFAAGDRDEVTRQVEEYGGRVISAQGRYIRVEIPAGAVPGLAASPRVTYVEEYRQPEFLNDRARDITGARPLAAPGFVTAEGLTGAGQTIGLADSGLDKGSMGDLHPDLQSEPGQKPRVIMLKSWAGVELPADIVGHGTHMAGTLVGSGKASGGKYRGVAPGASLYFQGIANEKDEPVPPLDLATLFYPAYDAGVRVHVNGWGRKGSNYAGTSAQVDDFVRRYPSFLVIFGAGNFGPAEGALTTEANSKNALVVGASISSRPAFEDEIGSNLDVPGFSSRGPAGDGRIKPELVAPGTSIISTCSRLVEGNLPGRPEYTIMRGSSMAAAVTGGAAALLRQYLEQEEGLSDPPAALVKAALINGARRLDLPVEAAGFGLLDLGATVLALQNDLFQVQTSEQGITTGETRTYSINIDHGGAPFKATLAWTDPAAAPGARRALVNDLDLEVTGPRGEKYLGNDFQGEGERDSLNNVEQVYIEDPEPGTYQVTVRGRSVPQDTVFGEGQDYALVFGRLPARAIAGEAASNGIKLAGGEEISLPEDFTVVVDDGPARRGDIPPGAELYLTGTLEEPEKVYAVARSWRAGGVKALLAGDTTVLVRINREYRDGGYPLDEEAEKPVFLNDRPLGEGMVLPPGAAVTAWVQPFRQTLWQVKASATQVEGILSSVDREGRQVQLLDRQETYQLAGDASISFSDVLENGDPADLPFGAPVAAGLERLVSGMPVDLVLGSNGKVYHLAVRRHVAVGRVAGVDPAAGKFNLAAGGSYRLLSGIEIRRDGRPAEMKQIKAGDLAVATLVPGTAEVLNLALFSQAAYGRLVYAGDDMLYLLDSLKGFRTLRYAPEMHVFRWGMPAGRSVLSPGQWVRVIDNPDSGEVRRVDVAEESGRVRGAVRSVAPGGGSVTLASGETYLISRATTVTKNDLPVAPRDLLPGEPATVTPLQGPGGVQVAASLEAAVRPGVQPPVLKVRSTIPTANTLLISGRAGATKLYAHLPGGRVEKVNLSEAGDFYYPVQVEEPGELLLVAVAGDTGGVSGVKVDLPAVKKGFTDIDGHWAEVDIMELVSRGMLQGYPDGTFRPDRPVNRVEFTAMLSRLLGSGSERSSLLYRDAGVIPRWARSAVALAAQRGLAVGYDDNTFRPYNRITREEAAALLVRAYGLLWGQPGPLEKPPAEPPAYADRAKISRWAVEQVALAKKLGLMGGKPGNLFAPQDQLTRAEAAAAINRLLNLLTTE